MRSWRLSEVRQETEPNQTDHKSGKKNANENRDFTFCPKSVCMSLDPGDQVLK